MSIRYRTRSGELAVVTVNAPDRSTLLADLESRLVAGRGFTVATLNLDHVVKLSDDPDFRAAYDAQTHVTADGNPIVWLSRLARDEVFLVPGSELVAPLAARAARLDVPVALVGGTAASLDAAAAALENTYPGLRIVLRFAPSMGFDPTGGEAEQIIRDIARSGARLVFLALGAPRQERFAARAQADLPDVGFLSIGAGLDFVSGAQVRAPLWVRRLAAEWLWRMLHNPRRLAGRYAACVAVLPGLIRQAALLRRERRTS